MSTHDQQNERKETLQHPKPGEFLLTIVPIMAPAMVGGSIKMAKLKSTNDNEELNAKHV